MHTLGAKLVTVESIVDSVATGRVLVVGALPPAGRDYDLLVTEGDRDRISAALKKHGFESIGRDLALFGHGRPAVVELLTSADWRLPAEEAAALFARGSPVDQHARLCRPSPADELLILARKLPRTPGLLERKHRLRIQAAVAANPAAWDEAAKRARAWGLQRRLHRLRSRFGRKERARWPPSWLHRPRPGAVIALSGIDGVGKSTQAEALRASLTALGFDAIVIWSPIGHSAPLRRFAAAAKRLLVRLPFGPLANADPAVAQQRLLSRGGEGVAAEPRSRRAAASVWSAITALANAVSYRRFARGARTGGKIVIFDRYVLDGIVYQRFEYSPYRPLRFQEAVLQRLSPTPRCAFLLDAPAALAHARKPDWPLDQMRLQAVLYRREYERLGVRRLDATRPPAELTSQIVREVLRRLHRA
jgi:thymidylate kinase